jgi:UDPglucose 6-dehydrogenase
MKKLIGVIGQGFVGGALTAGMTHAYNVHTCDISSRYSEYAKSGTTQLAELVAYLESKAQADRGEFKFVGVYFVCLPTPMRKDGSCDISIVEGVLNELASFTGKRIAVIKSTIPPGTTERWNRLFLDTGLTIVFNPEFLTEANAIEDFKNQNRIIVGGPRPASGKVKQVFQAAFPKTQIIKTSSTIAEMVKYVTNCFLATKVSFANEMYQICQELKIDYDKVSEYAKYDDRLGKSHWAVPGPDGHLGFGGHCFPKDMNALLHLAKSLSVNPEVLQAVLDKNNSLRTSENRDWEQMLGRAISKDYFD